MFLQTNRTTARIFPAVLDVENPEFKRKLDRMVEINTKLLAIGETDDIDFVKNLKRIPLIAALASELLSAYLMKPIESGSVDLAEFEPQLVYWNHNLYSYQSLIKVNMYAVIYSSEENRVEETLQILRHPCIYVIWLKSSWTPVQLMQDQVCSMIFLVLVIEFSHLNIYSYAVIYSTILYISVKMKCSWSNLWYIYNPY